MKRTNQRIKVAVTQKVIFWSVGLFIFFSIVSYVLAPPILEYVIHRKIQHIENEKRIRIEMNNFKLHGLSSLSIGSMFVIPIPNDTLLAIRSLDVKFSFWQLLLFRPDIESVSMKTFRCWFIKRDSYCNYQFLFKSSQKENVLQNEKTNYSQRISSIMNVVFRILPSNLAIDHLKILSKHNNLSTVLSSENIRLKNHALTTLLKIEEAKENQIWQISGLLDKENRTIVGKIINANGAKATFPYIKQIYHIQISFNELSFHLSSDQEGRITLLIGQAAFKGLDINHDRLSPGDIQLGNGSLVYQVRIGSDYAQLDSHSLVTLNMIDFHPSIFLQKKDKWHLKVQVDKPSLIAADLFSSLPKGLFRSLENVRVKGSLRYHFLLDVNLNNPDSLKLESSLKPIGFGITAYGELAKMNAPFLYTAYEKDQPVRTFEVGASNSSFRSLQSISPLLRQAVLQSEDGQFFFHRGFRLDALREALIHDIKMRKFARGGSTISMQLVKNVFLNRHKNMARKLEEALVVWLIEENRITTKERMFEVYLNIAEWGPMIYGIGEASHFYFNKDPADLTLNESIFLSSIIPSPKRFDSLFDLAGNLKENRYWHFNNIAERLFRTGYITEEERIAFLPAVVLTGVAKERIAIAQTDSTGQDLKSEGSLQ